MPIFRRDNDSFHLDQWFVFADGTSRIGTEEPLQDLDVVLQRVSSGELSTKVPDGSLIRFDGLGSCRVSAGHWFVEIEQRREELRDLLRQARGHDSAITNCRNAFSTFTEAPTDESRESLRLAYEAVPKHLRMYCGDMDSKDSAIRHVLYNQEHCSID